MYCDLGTIRRDVKVAISGRKLPATSSYCRYLVIDSRGSSESFRLSSPDLRIVRLVHDISRGRDNTRGFKRYTLFTTNPSLTGDWQY